MFRRMIQKGSARLFVINHFNRNNRRLVSSSRLMNVNYHKEMPRILSYPNYLIYPAHLTALQFTQQRGFWGVSVAFNQVDPERVRLAGADRAAAEWILRNGGSIKWKDSPRPLDDYNLLPSTDFDKYKIEEIDLTATDVIGLGFQHLENLQHVKSIKLHGCRTIMNDALEHIHFVKDTLMWLEISRCPMITDKGLENLHILKKLKTLVIYDLIELKNFEDSVSKLGQAMPWCEITCDDPLLTPPENDDANKS